jgi:carboxylesterase
MGKILIEEFEKDAGPCGCLLVHGLTGSPFEMQSLGEALWRDGFSVSVPRLAGHATDDWRDLAKSRWTDWFEVVENKYERLATRCEKIILIGLSIGGVLCLYFASRRLKDASALVLMATPLNIMNPIKRFGARVAVSLFPSRAYKAKASSTINDPVARANHLTGLHVAYAAALSAEALLKRLKRDLHQVITPTLMIYSRLDPQVSPADGDYIHSHISASQKKLVWLSRSYHIVTRDYEKELVQDEILKLACRVRDEVQPVIA